MIVITIEYKPFGLLKHKRFDAMLPSGWGEMTPDQLTTIPDLRRGVLDESKLLQIFLGIKRAIAERIDSYQKFCILKNLNYIEKPEPFGSFIIKKLLWYRAPAPMLKDLTFGAFIYGDTYYQNYINGDKYDLDRFIACFYYDKKGFNEKLIENHATIIRAADLKTREAIAINYVLIREWLATTYPYVFQKAAAGIKPGKYTGWVGVFDSVVGDDIANHEKYAASPLSLILRYLNNKTKEYYKNGGKV